MKHSTLGKKFVISTYWNILTFPFLLLISFISSVLITNLLSTLEFGVYMIFLSGVSTLFLVGDLGISGSLPKFTVEIYAQRSRTGVANLAQIILAVRVTLIIVILCVLFLFSNFLHNIYNINENDKLHFLAALSFVVLLDSIADTFQVQLTSFFAQKRLNGAKILFSITQSIFVIFSVIAGFGIKGVLFALVAASSIKVLVISFLWRGMLGSLEEKTMIKMDERDYTSRFAKSALVMFFLKISSYFSSPQFIMLILAIFLEKEQIAIFGLAADFFLRILDALTTWVNSLLLPLFSNIRVGESFSKLQKAYSLLTKAYILILVPAGFGLWVITGELLKLLYPVTYLQARRLILVFIFFIFLDSVLYPILSSILITYEKYGPLLFSRSVLVANILILFWIIPQYGMMGAAICYGASRLLASLMLSFYSWRVLNLRFPVTFLFKISLLSAAMASFLFSLKAFLPVSAQSVVLLVILGLMVFFFFFKMSGGFAKEDKIYINGIDFPLKTFLIKLF